eukprot:612069-Hanusia_phi.AAC.1
MIGIKLGEPSTKTAACQEEKPYGNRGNAASRGGVTETGEERSDDHTSHAREPQATTVTGSSVCGSSKE